MARRILTIIISAVILCLGTACDLTSPDDIMTEGAVRFGDGKSEDNYDVQDTGALLDELIEKYSGSYYNPSGRKMSDDEFRNAKRRRSSQKESSDESSEQESSEESSKQESSEENSEQETSEESSKQESSEESSDQESSEPDVEDYKASSVKDLLRIFKKAFSNNDTLVVVELVDGFTYDFTDNTSFSTGCSYLYRKLEREDPIGVSGIYGWSYRSEGNVNYIGLYYSFDIDELRQMKKDTVTLLKQAKNNIHPKSNSDYDIAVAVNDYLCDTVYYPPNEPYEPVTHTAYGAFKNGCAVCEGYACAAKLLLNEFGVESDIEMGMCRNGGGHAWNLVKVDGNWYQMDVTWNDPSPDRHTYFLVTDDYMKMSRSWDESDYPKTPKVPYAA